MIKVMVKALLTPISHFDILSLIKNSGKMYASRRWK